MKVLVIKSDYSDVPLAEVRTDGRVIEFVVDNTNGKLPSKIGTSFQALQAFVKNSSHMTISEATKATVNLLRYVMNNGDVVEITSDGHTVMLNGNLLGQEEKDALFAAVKRGEIKVARKTDISQAMPVMPPTPQPEMKPVKMRLSPEILDKIKSDQDKQKEIEEMNNASHDQEIEDAELHDAEDKEWTRRMMYWLKYGDEK